MHCHEDRHILNVLVDPIPCLVLILFLYVPVDLNFSPSVHGSSLRATLTLLGRFTKSFVSRELFFPPNY